MLDLHSKLSSLLAPVAGAALGAGVLLFALAGCRSSGAAGDWVDLDTRDHWRAYQGDAFPDSWECGADGLHLVRPGGPDLVSVDTYGSFELELDWRISTGGNSGVMYHVSEDQPASYMTGPEMQVLDDAAFPEAEAVHRAGADYALYAPASPAARPAGEWNHARMRVDGPHVETWLNGKKQADYELWSDEWSARVAASKFAAWPSFGRNLEGHLALQDHGNEVAYKNVRVRRL